MNKHCKTISLLTGSITIFNKKKKLKIYPISKYRKIVVSTQAWWKSNGQCSKRTSRSCESNVSHCLDARVYDYIADLRAFTCLYGPCERSTSLDILVTHTSYPNILSVPLLRFLLRPAVSRLRY